ncbi:MAG: UDP-3-O-acyl-N-acetylglucosamine deacetylase [Rickettsiales bacterium]|jgi:UDP-3-O-[3-hydroxymyristoyl] N-acetylglucosamine deacetylase
MFNLSQKTINNSISCNSVGLHTGCNVNLTIKPAPINTGIIFKRIDVSPEKNSILAHFKNVTTTNLGTTITNEFGVGVSTIEHFMAALWGCGIDNLIVEIDNIEIPIMDGSSQPFVFLLECAGINHQDANREIIEITEKIRLEDGDKFIEVLPSRQFTIDLNIDFNHPLIDKKSLHFNSASHSFKNDLCMARTFCFKHEIEKMHQMKLALGGSLDNAIVVDTDKILNPGPLRYHDEFVRHKALDFIGDLFLAGKYIVGHFTANKMGHSLNNKFLHHLFNNPQLWRLV